tara:strand:- start:1031 stop:2380 length:1350 start_codon:yes stop_codon:yes gene_type:complete
MCDTSGPNTGAVLRMNAIGKQDTYLLSDEPDKSFFKYDSKNHAHFTKFHKSLNVSKPSTAKPNWPFGETIKVTLNPRNMGDLLSNMYISLTLPSINNANDEYFADQVGRHIFKSITMRVDDLIVETFHDDWGVIYDEMYLDESEKRTKRYTLNRNLAEDTSLLAGNAVFGGLKSKLFIPIPFFFSRKYESDEYETNKPNRPYFPTCAIHKQKIEFEFVFRPKTFFTNAAGTVSLDGFDIITEEITIPNEERVYIKSKEHTFITDVVKKHPSLEIKTGETDVKLELVPDIPVKNIFWFFRQADFEIENIFDGTGNTLLANVFANRYNFSSNVEYSVKNEFYNPPMEKAKIFINGEDMPNLQDSDHKYYKYVVPFTSRLSRPYRNIYTYAFSMNPINVEPSGSLDFSQLQSNKTTLEVNMKSGLTRDYTLHAYYVGYQTFSFKEGFMSRAY